jgi:hypothetical protein
VAVAAAAVDLENADPAKKEHYVNEAFQAATSHPKLPEVSPWLLYRLVRLGVAAGMDDKALALAKQIPSLDLRGRAELEVLRARLAKMNTVADDTQLQVVEKNTPAYALAIEAWTRHNARAGGTAVLKSVEALPEKERRFGYIGTVLGLQDAAHRQ